MIFTPKNKRLYWVNGQYQKRRPNRKDRKVIMIDDQLTFIFREAMKVKRILENHKPQTRNLKNAINKIDGAIYVSQRY